MDNLVLHRLAHDLAAELEGSVLEQLRQEAHDRFRLVFARDAGPLALIVSLDPALPWVGVPPIRWEGPRWSPEPPVAAIAKRLSGLRIAHVEKSTIDRSLRFGAEDGTGVVLELRPQGSNLVQLGPGMVIESALRARRRSAERLTPGGVWTPAPPPHGRRDPFTASAAELDAGLDGYVGLGLAAPAVACSEAERSGRTVGAVLVERLAGVREGTSEIVIIGPDAPRDGIRSGTFEARSYRLLPWRPAAAAEEEVWTERSGLATAGLFHEGIERVARHRQRLATLDRILRVEIRRTEAARVRADSDARGFEAPEALTRRGEALLAGLSTAERVGDRVVVPDPYEPDGPSLVIAIPPGLTLTELANDLFRKSRRARRGREAAAARGRSLAAREARLDRLAETARQARTEEDAEALEGAMRAERMPVGLERATRAGRAADRLERPQLAGIRVLTSADGWNILVGKTARDNDRLTFKLAGPDDLWLHAAGATGAHVVVKTAEKGDAVPETTLKEAAQAAAWFSDARGHGLVDVHWARRKHVRRAGRGSPGLVVLKRFQTIRVPAVAPRESD